MTILSYSDLYSLMSAAFCVGLFFGYVWGFAQESFNWRLYGKAGGSGGTRK